MWYLFHSTICSSLYPCTGSILGMDSANGWRRYVMTTHGKSIQRCWWPSDISFHGITKSDIELNFRADYKLDYERRLWLQSNAVSNWLGGNLESALNLLIEVYPVHWMHICTTGLRVEVRASHVAIKTHWSRDKMAAISQIKMYGFRLKFHWRLFLRV